MSGNITLNDDAEQGPMTATFTVPANRIADVARNMFRITSPPGYTIGDINLKGGEIVAELALIPPDPGPTGRPAQADLRQGDVIMMRESGRLLGVMGPSYLGDGFTWCRDDNGDDLNVVGLDERTDWQIIQRGPLT